MRRISTLLLVSVLPALCYCLDAPAGCGTLTYPDEDFAALPFDQVNRTGNLERFCQSEADTIRQEHFWCRGYMDSDMNVVAGTARAKFPTTSDDFWTIFLQYPVLSWMDVARKAQIMRIIEEVAETPSDCQTNINDYRDFCVSNVETYEVAEYRESVLVTLYNLGVDGATFENCFRDGLRSGNPYVTGFRGKTALLVTLNVSLIDMFNQNIGPASSIGNEFRDPTLRPVYLNSWAGNVSLSAARDGTSDSRFASNPNPINYGLEAGDIVFAVFGSILLVVVGALAVLGFFIHPFFLS
jgi:hypothetical protein